MKKSNVIIISIIFILGFALIYQALFNNNSAKMQNSASEGKQHNDNSSILQAPDIVLRNLRKKKIKFSDFKDKVIVLNFWATWCPPCRAEFPSMLDLTEYYDGKLVLIAVSQDKNPDVIKSFLNTFNAKHSKLLKSQTFHAIWDEGNKISGRTFGVHRFPESFVINKKGMMIRKIPGAIDWMSPNTIAYFDSLMK